jgi:hypothetical protein
MAKYSIKTFKARAKTPAFFFMKRNKITKIIEMKKTSPKTMEIKARYRK